MNVIYDEERFKAKLQKKEDKNKKQKPKTKYENNISINTAEVHFETAFIPLIDLLRILARLFITLFTNPLRRCISPGLMFISPSDISPSVYNPI